MKDQILRTAIEQRKLLKLRYNGKERIVEPHDYGIHNGTAKLLAWQVSSPANWRWFQVEQMEDVELLEQTFAGGRAVSGDHHKWDQLFARVKPSASSPD